MSGLTLYCDVSLSVSPLSLDKTVDCTLYSDDSPVSSHGLESDGTEKGIPVREKVISKAPVWSVEWRFGMICVVGTPAQQQHAF